jgi:hypothetical protein
VFLLATGQVFGDAKGVLGDMAKSLTADAAAVH